MSHAKLLRNSAFSTVLGWSLTGLGADVPPAGERDPFTTRPSVMAGLNQWLLFGGGNIAGQLKTGRWVFEYSHGQALKLDRIAEIGLTHDERDAGVSLEMPWTTGGGFGYQITPNLHVLVELKAHRYEVRGSDRNEVDRYTTITAGPGVFYDLYLFEGFFIQPNARWWPTIASTHDPDHSVFTSEAGTYRHARHDLLPFINVNIGWTMSGI
jgi:hypothetical protein